MSGWRVWRWTLWIGVPAAVAVVAYRDRAVLADAAAILARARLGWLVPGVAAIGGVYLCRAFVYGIPLRLLRYSFARAFLWRVALMSTSLHQVIPAGGASGYAFLTYALHQRGVPAGEASVIALVDTLSYAAAVAALVVASLVYLLTAGMLAEPSIVRALPPGLALFLAGAAVYYVQRDRGRLFRVVLGLRRWVARLGWRWREQGVRTFLRDYLTAKSIVAGSRAAFVRMVGLQFLAVGCDALALCTTFAALGIAPPVWTVFMGLVVAMAGGAVVAAPGGGGSFELIMTAFFAAHGVPPERGLAAAVLYRVLAFWLPVTVTVVLLLDLRRRHRAIRRQRRRAT